MSFLPTAEHSLKSQVIIEIRLRRPETEPDPAVRMPAKSLLPYAVGGERMASYTFEYSLQSYRNNPTTDNKALMLFFSCVNFLGYTVMGNYLNPENNMYDPNIIREEAGCSKEMLLGLFLTKTPLRPCWLHPVRSVMNLP